MKQILAIADLGRGAQPALARAVTLARQSGAALHCVAFTYATGLASLGSEMGEQKLATARNRLVQQRQELLQEQLQALGADSRTSFEVVWEKDLASWTADYCAAHAVDLVIKTGNRSERWNYTPTDWRLLRTCPAPVMVVAERSWKKRARVLAALDLATRKKPKQQLNRKILHSARQLADAFGSELHAVYVIEVPTVLADLDLIDRRQHIAKVRRAVAPRVAELAAEFGMQPEQFHIVAGPPERVVPGVASKLKAETVVLGTIGRKGLKARLIGNTAEAVLGRLRTDIIAVRPD